VTHLPVSFCCCTASMQLATDGAETAAVDGLVSSWSENIAVSFCLRAPGYQLTLWCVLVVDEWRMYLCLLWRSMMSVASAPESCRRRHRWPLTVMNSLSAMSFEAICCFNRIKLYSAEIRSCFKTHKSAAVRLVLLIEVIFDWSRVNASQKLTYYQTWQLIRPC